MTKRFVPDWRQSMPLAWAAPECNAWSKSAGRKCRAKAIRGRAKCRHHGGKGSGAPRGNTNGVIHGRYSRAAEEKDRLARQAERELAAKLDTIAAKYEGLVPRTRRRKRENSPATKA